VLREKLRPADLRGEDHCVRCTFCCQARTCVPAPAEVEAIARFLELTPRELLRTLCVADYQWDPRETVYYPRFVGVRNVDLAGTVVSNDRTYNEGACTMLDGNACRIWEVIPREGREAACWREPDTFEPRLEWKAGQLERMMGYERGKIPA